MIQRGNKFFKVAVVKQDGELVEKSQLLGAITTILKKPLDQALPPVGILTSQDRNTWADTRDELISLSNNEAILKDIDSALFVVCLEHEQYKSFDEISKGMLCGTGKNRWFDKSFQLIVAANGKSSVNFEHAWGDGVAVLRYFNAIFEDSNKSSSEESRDDLEVSELCFELSDSLKTKISLAEAEADSLVANLDIASLKSDKLGKQFCKNNKLSADGCMQMMFQLGYYMNFGNIRATYESASTAGFKHGRTETIRSATQEAKIMAETLTSSSSTKDEQKTALLNAIKNHSRITKQALLGKGIDRHLFALKSVAIDEGLLSGDIEQFYIDDTMNNMNNFILSTSTLSSPALLMGGFGPGHEDNYGIAYAINKDSYQIAVANFKHGSLSLRDSIENASSRIRSILES